MSTDVFAWGSARFTALPGTGIGAGVRTPFGTLLPPGGRVLYVRSTGVQDGDTNDIKKRLIATLADALKECRSGLGDTVILLPGHTENFTDNTMLANLVNGTRIVGMGHGSMMPTLRGTAVGSQLLINKTDIFITGIRLRLEGAAITKAISVTGADCVIDGCDIEVGSATAAAVIALGVDTGATRCTISNNRFRGLLAAPVTDNVLIAGTAVDGVRVFGNTMILAGTTTNGLIRCTAAATGLEIYENNLVNTVAVSVATINFSNVAATGICYNNRSVVLSTGALSAGVTGITVGGTNNLVGFFNNLVVNDPNKSGLLEPAADT